jgi:glycosyltransferase involved in cell wall biosynthesis
VKVALLSSWYLPHFGGTERYVHDLAHVLAGRGHSVSVFTHTSAARLDPEPESTAAPKVVRVPAVWMPYLPVVSAFPARQLAGFDVIHSNAPPFVFSLQPARHGLRVPHVLTYHCDVDFPELIGHFRLPRRAKEIVDRHFLRVARRTLLHVDRIIATTASYAETSPVLRRYRFEVVPIGVHFQRFDDHRRRLEREGVRRDSQEILYVGRLTPSKGLAFLLDAVELLFSRGRPFHLTIVGDGEEMLHLKMMVHEKRLTSLVDFAGKVSFDDLLTFYARAAVLVLPSFVRLEAFGIVQIEAMAMGVPVVATDLPGMREIVANSGGGLLVPPRDPAALAAALESIFDDPDLARRMDSARRYVRETYDWDNVAGRLEAIYASLIEKRHRRGRADV